MNKFGWLLIKFKLFINMLVAANTAGLAIFLCAKYLIKIDADYGFCIGLFLIYRVCAFMANKQMPLTDENVAFMSSERTLWNSATVPVCLVTAAIIYICERIFG